MRGLPAVQPLTLGESSTVRVGDPTLTIGNPFGVDRTLTSGTVSALQHRLPASDGQAIDNVIQTDQPIDAGNAGGPLLDAGGQVIGINSEVTTPENEGRSGQALAFACRSTQPTRSSSGPLTRDRLRVADIGLGAASPAGRAPGEGLPAWSAAVRRRSPGSGAAM